ncbi:hypothetical protein CupriaWKF_33630 [Cupriavidus sp. WKF15]|uniref:hypothetical protein n=1 Tax=Cupriavidus TaxID=106589 RepID=UPI00112CC1A3|nr:MULTISPECIES: hypothetical protein [Cupriavidus]WER50487.1 hypothetical protein CupriaWKF_33630 [Cupriavidus sp. WKF15]
MGQQTHKPQQGQDVPDLPSDGQSSEEAQPMHDEGLGRPQRQPGQVDIGVPAKGDAGKDA